ncbi:unnamed protein product [Leuciscus chuanchicus]
MLYCQPTTGQLPPREQLRLQITDRKTYPQQVHVRLIQACPVYRAHYPSSVAQYIGTSARRTEDSLSHAEAKVEHMFNQLEKVTVTQLGLLSTNHHSRRLLGVWLRVVAATRTLFNIGTSSVNAANQTANSMKPLFTVLQSDFVQTQLVTALTTDMLWDVNSSNDSLATGVIPPYLILSLMLTVLASAINTPADLLQIHLAYSLGSAISLCVDPEQREVGFLLNLPIIESSQVYRLTDIVKVRFWKNNTHIKISPPDVVAYHDSDTQRYSAPNLHLCTMTKDIHYLCLSKPLLRDNAEEIYGLHPLVSKVTNTQAEIAGERWRANTPVHTATVTHDQHDTTSRVNMLNQKMGLQVPKGVILHLDGLTWYQLPSKEYQTALKLPSSKNFNFTLNPGLELWIEKRGSQLTDPAPVNTALRALSRRPVLNTSSAVQAGTAAYIGLCTSAVNQPHPNTRLASILSRRLNEMRYSQAHESCVQRFQMESPERGCQIRDHAEPHRAESSAPRTTCLPTVMIHLLHDCDMMKPSGWLISIEGRVVIGPHPFFLHGLAAFFSSYYVFNIEYPAAGSSTLEFIQRCFLSINPERGSKTKKRTTMNPHRNCPLPLDAVAAGEKAQLRTVETCTYHFCSVNIEKPPPAIEYCHRRPPVRLGHYLPPVEEELLCELPPVPVRYLPPTEEELLCETPASACAITYLQPKKSHRVNPYQRPPHYLCLAEEGSWGETLPVPASLLTLVERNRRVNLPRNLVEEREVDQSVDFKLRLD